jgi:ribonuclease HII
MTKISIADFIEDILLQKSLLLPDNSFEHQARIQGYSIICGVDEAGRGPLAGPVVAAAVILPEGLAIEGLHDSKSLNAKKREALCALIFEQAHVAFACASPQRIDALNIRGATLWAMAQAVRGLPFQVDMALIDGRDTPPDLTCKTEAIIKGDARCLSIAAASIVAKTMRDRIMVSLGQLYPGYGMEKHMGYPTKAHIEALDTLGVTPHHRTSFAPVRLRLGNIS